MLFKIVMNVRGLLIDPLDSGLHLIEACYRAALYKRRNESATFTVVNEDNGDIEYQV